MPRTMSVYEAAKVRGLWTPELLKREGKLLALYDYNQAGTVTTASGKVTGLRDASGFGIDLTAPGVGPTYSADGFGGNPCGSYAGATTEGLVNWSTGWGSGRTYYAFAAATMIGNATGYDRLVSFSAPSGTDYDFGGYIPLERNAMLNEIQSYSNANLDSRSASLSTPMLLSSRLTGSLTIVSVNGVSGSGTSYTTPSNSISRVGLGISADAFEQANWNGLIHKVLIGVSFTARDQALVEGWGAWDTGFVSLLPAGHEFKNRPPMNWD